MDAAHTRNREMAELLLDAGADVKIHADQAQRRCPRAGRRRPRHGCAPREARAGGGSVGEMSV